MKRLLEVLQFLNIPHYLSLKEWDQEGFIRGVQQNRREFRPKTGNGEKLDFSPPPISPKQKEVLNGLDVGVRYNRVDLDCSISTLRSLARKGLVEGDDKEEIWIRFQTEWI